MFDTAMIIDKYLNLFLHYLMLRKAPSIVEKVLIGHLSNCEPDAAAYKEMSVGEAGCDLANLVVQVLEEWLISLMEIVLDDVLALAVLPSVSSIWFDDFETRF